MAGISQQIPNYSRGMSEQPDQLKTPGQVKNIVNGIPDVTYGLFKRPGSKRIGIDPLASVQSGGSWFHYYRDETEGSYIGQIDSTGNVRVWSCEDGAEMTVKYGDNDTEKTAVTTYLTPNPSSDTEDIQALTINDTTFLNNREIAVKHLNGTDDLTDARPDTYFAYIELIRSENGRQYGLNLYNNDEVQSYSTATGIKIKSDNLGEGIHSGDCAGIGTQVFNSSASDTEDVAAVEKLSFVLATEYNNDDDLFTSNGRIQEFIDSDEGHPGIREDRQNEINNTKEEYFLDATRDADNNSAKRRIPATATTVGDGTWDGWLGDGYTYDSYSPQDAVGNNTNRDVNVYYKLRNSVTGVTCISAKVTGTANNGGNYDVILQQIVTAFTSAVAHEDLDKGGTTTYSGSNEYLSDSITTVGVPEGSSIAYGELPFALSTNGVELLLTYKTAGSVIEGQWELTRCNDGAAVHPSELSYVLPENKFINHNQDLVGEDNDEQFWLFKENASISGISSSGRRHRYARIQNTDIGKGLDRPNTPRIQSTLVTQGSKAGNTRKNLIFRITALGQLSTKEDSSNNNEFQCTYNRDIVLLHGGENFITGDTVDVVLDQAKGGALDPGTTDDPADNNATYNTAATYTVEVTDHELVSHKANIKAARPVPTPFDSDTAVTSDAILGGIQAEINGLSINGYTLKNRVIGNGLYLSCEQPFNVSIVEKDLMRVMQGSINDVTELPNQCKHGYIVKVANARMSDEDDYYLKFIGDNNRDGSGSWSECAKPGIVKSFDPATMPHVLQRTAVDTFTVKPFTWGDREVGDENTNPIPSFVSILDGHDSWESSADDKNNYINKVLFFRNRLAFLSGENVILCKPGTLASPNFWAETALTVSSVDPIDIACSSTFPSALFDGIEVNTGLLAFSTNQQFLLSSDDTVLNPDTAKLRSVSTYNYNSNIPPISLGTTVGYIDNSGKYSRFNQMANITREGEPIVIEESKLVPTLLGKDIDLITNSRENQIVLFGKTGTDTVVGFRYFISGDKRLQGAWFKWKFNDTLKYHFIINDEYFYLDEDNFLQKMSLIQSNDDLSIDKDDVNYKIHLDNYVEGSGGVFNSNNNKTVFNLDWLSSVTSTATTDYLTDNLTIASGGTFSDGIISFTLSTNLVEDTIERTAHSTTSLRKNVQCSAVWSSGTRYNMFGLSNEPPEGFKGVGDSSGVDNMIDYAWSLSNTYARINISGGDDVEVLEGIALSRAGAESTDVFNALRTTTNVEPLDPYIKETDVFKITYDGEYVRWYQNDKEKHRLARNVGDKLYFDSVVNSYETEVGSKKPQSNGKLEISQFVTYMKFTTTAISDDSAQSHLLSTGDAVQFFENGHAIGGLTDGNIYYVYKISANTFYLASSYVAALAGIVLTYTSGAGTNIPSYFVTHETYALKNVTFTDLIPDNRKLAAIDTDNGRYSIGTVSGNTFTVDGEWTNTINIGYLYDYQVDFPTIYPTNTQGEVTRADVNSSLTLHRLNFNFGKVGSYETTLTRLGKDPYTEIYESANTNLYEATEAPYLEEAIKTIPVYERNKNVDITLKSTSPTPATLHSMSWEGDFSSKYYKRV